MTPNAKHLNDILEQVENASSDSRHLFYSDLQTAIHTMQEAGEDVPASVRDLAETLLSEAVEARFDNMPV